MAVIPQPKRRVTRNNPPRNDQIALARKLFGSISVSEWLETFEARSMQRIAWTTWESQSLDVASSHKARAALNLTHVLSELFRRLSGGKKAEVNWRLINALSYHDAVLTLLPPASATVAYMGKTSDVAVEGAIGIECIARLDGKDHSKPTLVFVSHPFHQYRVLDVQKH